MSLYLSKQQQSAMANAMLNRVKAKMPDVTDDQLRKIATMHLELKRSTYPWEYPWVEVVRWCWERRQT